MTCSCWTWAPALAGVLRHCTPLHNPVTRASEACDPRASVAEEGGAAGAAGNSDKLKRALKLWDVVAITIGTIIGSGIFASANRVLKQAGSVGHMLLVWVCRWLRLVIDAQQSLMRAICSGILVTLGALVRSACFLQDFTAKLCSSCLLIPVMIMRLDSGLNESCRCTLSSARRCPRRAAS